MNEYQAFAERISQLYITHPKVKRIHGMLDSIRAHKKFSKGKSSPRHSFFIGDSGVGKSVLLKSYADMNPGYVYIDDEGTEYDIRPVIYVEIPEPFTVLELYQSIVSGLGAPLLPGKPTIGEVKRQVFKLIKDQKVEMLILDEMDYILTSRHVKPIEAMEVIKHIANQAEISLVCAGTPEAGKLRKLKDQYLRRYPPITLKRFETCDDEFYGFLEEIEKQIKPPYTISLGNPKTGLPDLLHALSRGLVGILTPTIQEAYRLLGVLEEDFNDFSKAKLTVDILLEAYQNIVGDLDQGELDEILAPKQIIA